MCESKIIEKIRKLLNMGNDPRGNEFECANALSQAQKLMTKYNLELADVIAVDLELDSNIVDDFIGELNYDKKIPKWYNVLATVIGRTFECHCKLVNTVDSNNKYKVGFKLLGYKTDVEVAKWLFSFILEQINKLTEQAWKQHLEWRKVYNRKTPWASERTKFKNNYRYGLVNGIIGKIKETYGKEEQKEVKTSSGTSLVVLKDSAIERKFDFKPDYINIKNRSKADEIYQGIQDSKKININKVIQKEEHVALV